jgi:hypothetical protein
VSARGKALVWAGVVAACILLVFIRVRVESGSELDRARAAQAKADRDSAGLHYRRAIRWYTPGSSSVEAGVSELWALAEAEEKAGRAAPALQLYRDLRGGLYAIRHLWEPYREVRDRAEERIAELMAREEPAPMDRGKSVPERRAEFLAQLRGVRAPDVAWSVALLIGFFGWVAAAAAFFWRGFTREGKLLPRPALWWGAAVVALFALWVVGMTQA